MSPLRRVLAIELSGRVGSVALRDEHGAVVERSFSPGDRTREPLLPEIDALLRAASIQRDGLSAVAVSVGPGGFTGLRISIAAAKGIAAALGIATVPVPTAIACAESARSSAAVAGARVLVVLASKRGTAWLHRVRLDSGAPSGWRDVAPPGIWSRQQLESDRGWQDLAGDAVFADAHQDREIIDWLESKGGAVVAGGSPPPTATATLVVGERLLAAGSSLPPEELLPLYPREPEAVTLWRGRTATTAERGS